MIAGTHKDYMKKALEEARAAAAEGEIPVGALVVRSGEVLSGAYNERERRADPTAHAEMLALKAAASRLGTWRLEDCALYVTLEPCPMCAGAIVLARLKLVVFGAYDPLSGAGGSRYAILTDGVLNHRVEVIGGVLETECAGLLRGYFRDK